MTPVTPPRFRRRLPVVLREAVRCPHCGGHEHRIRSSRRIIGDGRRQYRECRDCGQMFAVIEDFSMDSDDVL